MAIQMRRGNKADFDPTKMLPGEWAVSIDSDTTRQWVWMCFAPGVVKRMAAFEDIEWVLSDEFAKSAVICDVELDSTATKDYAVGDFLMLHGHLYEVTVAITTGDTIEEGTNVTETKVMDTIAGKVDKETGKGLSTNDYTDTEKAALAQAQSDIVSLNADLANKADDSVVVKSVNSKTPTNGAVEVTAEDIPADGIGDKSVSGNPITIEDGMASVAKELSVTLEPIQDLHGYESPWIGTDTDKQSYLFRAVADSSVQDKGTHELDKLVGGTVAWNQMVQNGNFADTTKWTPYYGATFTVANNEATITGNGNESGSRIFQDVSSVSNHKYLLHFDVKSDGNTGVNVTIDNATSTYVLTNYYSTSWGTFGKVIIPVYNTFLRLHFRCEENKAGTIYARNVMLIDLTQMFGSTIADYIYSLEQSTAGAGVAWFRNLFPAPYYPYNAGELISVKTSAHVMRGFNQWDEEWELGSINSEGQKVSSTTKIRSKNYIPCAPNTTYCRTFVGGSSAVIAVYAYDANYNYLPSIVTSGSLFTTPDNAQYLLFRTADSYGTTYKNDICINLSDPSKNGTYEPYEEHVYPLDPDLELRGIPKLDSNNKLYYDGDVYESSGNVQRKYGVVDLGAQTYRTGGSRGQLYITEIIGAKDGGNAIISNSKWANAPTTAPNSLTTGQFRVSTDAIYFYNGGEYESETTFTTAMSGVMLVYELATPTTETADPFASMQVIDTSGTEEYVDTRTVAIPVGHESNYANICPIEGRTGTEVQRIGKNLFDSDVLLQAPLWVKNDGYYTGTSDNLFIQFGDDYDGFPGLKFRENVQYTIRYTGHSSDASGNFRFRFLYTDGTLSDASYLNSTSDTIVSFTSTAGKTIDKLAVRYGSNRTIYLKDIQLEEGSTPTSYEPYSKDTASVTFGQTVYGGTVDFVSGKCRVTHGFIPDLGEKNYSYSGTLPNAYCECAVSGIKTVTDAYARSSAKCSNRKSSSQAQWTLNKPCLFQFPNTSSVVFSAEPYTDVASFKAAMSGVQLCYELATPIELTLTPAQLTLLQGTNILTGDGTINLTYLGSMASNVQDEIDEFEQGLNNVIADIAFIESTTAKANHAVGDYIVLNSMLCKVVSAITAGQTISIGGNVTVTTLGAELKAIWAQISA